MLKKNETKTQSARFVGMLINKITNQFDINNTSVVILINKNKIYKKENLSNNV